MRKGKRFTPARILRWQANGRGSGSHQDYIPFHQVSRDDPGSCGRSHLMNWRFGRQHHLLSDNELVVFGFITMMTNLLDVREQFPLSRETHVLEATVRRASLSAPSAMGTLEIASALGLKHPRINGGGVSMHWVMTSDFVVTITMPNQRPALLVVSAKSDEELDDRRTLERLRIEREYWRLQDINWLLIVPSMYGSAVRDTVKSAMVWAVRPECIDDQMHHRLMQISRMAGWFDGHTLPTVLAKIQDAIAVNLDVAQSLFWTAVWMGFVPLDLSMPIRPGASVRILGADAFLRQNPVASRRTAWKS